MEELTPERMAQIKDLMKDIQVTSGTQSVIQDNKLLFTYDNKVYRCRMPNQLEQDGAEKAQNQCKVRLAQEQDINGKPVNVTKRKWIEILKATQNIDIHELEKEKDEYRKKLQEVYLELAMVSSENESAINELKDKKTKVEEKFMELTIEIVEAIAPCIEEQAKLAYYRYLAYACTEKQIEVTSEFEPIWKSFEEFQKDGSNIRYKAVDGIQTLLLNI